MSPADLDALLEVLQRRGVRHYENGGLVMDIGPEPAKAEQTLEPTRAEIEAAHEKLLYAASEGMP